MTAYIHVRAPELALASASRISCALPQFASLPAQGTTQPSMPPVMQAGSSELHQPVRSSDKLPKLQIGCTRAKQRPWGPRAGVRQGTHPPTCPGLQRGALQGPPVGEGEAPGRVGARLLQRLQVERALLLAHAAAKEVDTGHCRQGVGGWTLGAKQWERELRGPLRPRWWQARPHVAGAALVAGHMVSRPHMWQDGAWSAPPPVLQAVPSATWAGHCRGQGVPHLRQGSPSASCASCTGPPRQGRLARHPGLRSRVGTTNPEQSNSSCPPSIFW